MDGFALVTDTSPVCPDALGCGKTQTLLDSCALLAQGGSGEQSEPTPRVDEPNVERDNDLGPS